MPDQNHITDMLASIDSFSVYGDVDDDWCIYASNHNGSGFRIVGRIEDRATANLMCQLLNAAVGAIPPDLSQEVSDLHSIVRLLNERLAKLERG